MGNVKGQGTGVDSVKSLAMPLKLIESGKFREAELMMEQYVRSNPEDAMAYLVLFSAKVNSLNLPTYRVGSAWKAGEREDNISLYAEHHEIFVKFFEFANSDEIKNALTFMKEYLESQIETIATQKISKGLREKMVAFFDEILGASISLGMEFYSDIALVMGKCLLRLSMFKEARGFFEEVTGERKSESLLYVLFCALEVVDEEQFARSKRFHVEMPEYIKLLVSLEENNALYEEITELIERNPRGKRIEPKPKKKPQPKGTKKVGAKKGASEASGKKQAPPKKEKIKLNDIRNAYEMRKGSPLSILFFVLFWLVTAVAFVYLLFVYNEGEAWKAFVELTPFGRNMDREESRVSMWISTVSILLVQVAVMGVTVFCRYKLIQRVKVYAICVPVVLASWYVGYAISQLPAYNIMTASIVTCCFFLPVIGIIVGFALTVLQFHKTLTNIKDIKFNTFRGEYYKKMYEKGFVAIPLLSSALYMLLNGMPFWYESFICVFLWLSGAMIAYVAFKNRILGMFLDVTNESADLRDRRKMAIMEWVTGLVLVVAAVFSMLLFKWVKVDFAVHIGLESVALLFGLAMLIAGIVAECKLYNKK